MTLSETEVKPATENKSSAELAPAEGQLLTEKSIESMSNGIGEKTTNGVETLSEVKEDSGGKEEAKEGEKKREKGEEKTEEEKKEKEESKVMKPEVKRLVNRYDRETGQNTTVESTPGDSNTQDKWAYTAICVTNLFNYRNELTRRVLEIKAPILKNVLKNAIGDGYPGVSFKTERVILNYPLRSLFHNLREIKEECVRVEQTSDEEEKKYLNLLQGFLDEELKEDQKNVNSLLPEGRITYDLLWTIFRPGTIFYTNIHGDAQAMMLIKGYEVCGQEPQYVLECWYVSYNGYTFGKTQTVCSVQPFDGSTKIEDLNCIPAGFHPQEKELRVMLITRGRRFEELQGRKYMQCKGTALGPVENQKRILYSINGRVMVDCESFERLNTDRATKVIPLDAHIPASNNNWVALDAYADGSLGFIAPSDDPTEAPSIEASDEVKKRKLVKPITEEEYVLCNSRVRGFALAQKYWAEFSIDDLTEVQWNDKVFRQLVLPEDQKELISALVESHTGGTDSFDDFIKGKGKGFISVLHGPPGVGKTLTAESIAEHTRRPLYTVTSGELGTSPEDLEQNLSRILDVAAAWKAILLIDEADVFLEKRSITHDITRNGLVSIFLRLLEYYEGIMFLTTNRITTFDEAFQTRIHLALRYDQLDKSARRNVWRNFLERIPEAQISLDLETDLEQLAELQMNGRMIKNVIKTASSLANRKKEGLGMRHLLQVLKIQSEFEKDFKG